LLADAELEPKRPDMFATPTWSSAQVRNSSVHSILCLRFHF
jgi:hypothetical protein